MRKTWSLRNALWFWNRAYPETRLDCDTYQISQHALMRQHGYIQPRVPAFYDLCARHGARKKRITRHFRWRILFIMRLLMSCHRVRPRDYLRLSTASRSQSAGSSTTQFDLNKFVLSPRQRDDNPLAYFGLTLHRLRTRCLYARRIHNMICVLAGSAYRQWEENEVTRQPLSPDRHLGYL